MSDYDDLKKYKFDEEPDGNPTTYHQKPKYATAIILGFLVSVLSIIVLSVISISLEKEFNYSFLITLWLIVKVEGKYIPDHSFWKVVIVGILSLMTILS